MKNKNDYSEFLKTENHQNLPADVTRNIFDLVHRDLNPSALKVFGKTSLIFFLVGGVSLLFCPQFGVGLHDHSFLLPLLMKCGDVVCMLICGAFFTSLSLLVTSFVLKAEEVRVLEHNKILQVGVLSTLSLGAIHSLGEGVVLTLGLIWVLGAILGGIASLELGWFLRRYRATSSL